jgi:hypothetical protein
MRKRRSWLLSVIPLLVSALVPGCSEETTIPAASNEAPQEMLDPTPYTAEYPAVFRRLGVEVFATTSAPEIKLVRHWLASYATVADGVTVLWLPTAVGTLDAEDVVRPEFVEFAVKDAAVDGDEWYLTYSPDMRGHDQAKSGATCWPCCFEQTPCTCTLGCYAASYESGG